jgi:hypothetical protein
MPVAFRYQPDAAFTPLHIFFWNTTNRNLPHLVSVLDLVLVHGDRVVGVCVFTRTLHSDQVIGKSCLCSCVKLSCVDLHPGDRLFHCWLLTGVVLRCCCHIPVHLWCRVIWSTRTKRRFLSHDKHCSFFVCAVASIRHLRHLRALVRMERY